MKILTILGQPTPGSFNHGIADRAVSVLESMGQQMFGVVCVSTPEERETHSK
jgi:NAD(P)H-dependent FMN reductase